MYIEKLQISSITGLRMRDHIASDVLMSLIESISAVFDRVFVVVDGINECDNRSELLLTIASIKTKKWNLLITSRMCTDVQRAFEGKNAVELDGPSVEADIATHVDWMSHNESLERLK